MENDQQTVTAYKGSDLQLGMISAGATPTVTMTHKMGLVRLNPTTKSVANKLTYTYNQANGSYTSSTSGTATITASSDFTGNKPYVVSSQYWHIVKATAAATNTAMSFTCNTNQKDYWSAKTSGTDIGYGKYKVIDIQSDRTAANFEALFSYVGTCQTVTLPWYDNYVMQCWGAQGGDIADGAAYPYGGHGGYTQGTLAVPKNRSLYVYVGRKGNRTAMERSFNGGGQLAAIDGGCASGGGATDVRLIGSGNDWANSSGLLTRIMVAGGGAGAERSSLAGAAGGLNSYDSKNIDFNIATQMKGYRVGYGENADFHVTASGAGGGYLGGITGGAIGYSTSGVQLSSAGGSSFISGHSGCVAMSSFTTKTRTILDNYTHTSVSDYYDDVVFKNNNIVIYNAEDYVFQNTKMIDGRGYSWTNVKGALEQMPTPSGGLYTSGTGHTGNGYAKITSQ